MPVTVRTTFLGAHEVEGADAEEVPGIGVGRAPRGQREGQQTPQYVTKDDLKKFGADLATLPGNVGKDSGAIAVPRRSH